VFLYFKIEEVLNREKLFNKANASYKKNQRVKIIPLIAKLVPDHIRFDGLISIDFFLAAD
jgi:hypothetical protein